MVDCLRIAVLNAQDELDLFEGTAVDIEKRLHEDRHDALPDSCSGTDVSEKGCHKAVCKMNDIQDVPMGEGLPLL